MHRILECNWLAENLYRCDVFFSSKFDTRRKQKQRHTHFCLPLESACKGHGLATTNLDLVPLCRDSWLHRAVGWLVGKSTIVQYSSCREQEPRCLPCSVFSSSFFQTKGWGWEAQRDEDVFLAASLAFYGSHLVAWVTVNGHQPAAVPSSLIWRVTPRNLEKYPQLVLH